MFEPPLEARTGPEDRSSGFEDLLSRCIAALAGDGSTALEVLLAQHPEHAERLRRRLAELERLGLLELGAGSSFPRVIGGHRVLRRLGSGGMGDVYLATEPDTGRAVALKWARLAPPRSGEGEHARARARFEREARAIGRLSHPGIATVHQVGEHEGRPWFTMDVVAGVTLSEVLSGLRARGIPVSELGTADVVRVLEAALALREDEHEHASVQPPRAESYVEWCVRVVLDLADALDHAHRQGIVHRDVKPSNVMIRLDGGACLFDLGLAHLEDMPTITRSGDFAGTPHYVAPEQVEGRHEAIDGRTDVWGLAVTLFELLTLRRPFEGEGTPEILRRILEREPPSARRLHEGLPRDLEAVLVQALEKDPGRRYRDMRSFAADLERLLAFRPVVARPPGGLARLARLARRRPAVAAAWTLALLVVLGLPLGLFLANRAIRVEAAHAAEAAAEARDQAQARARVLDHLVDLFRAPEAASEGMVAALDGQLERIDVIAGEGALARASMLEAAGTIYRNLGLFERALPPLDRALALRTAGGRGSALDTAGLLEVLAGVHLELGDRATSSALCRRGLDVLADFDGSAGPVRARLSLTLARALDARADGPEIERLLAVAESDLGAGATPSELADVAVARAGFARELGEHERARAELERALALRRESWLPDPARLAADLEHLAELEAGMGLAAAASDRRAQARELRRAGEHVELQPPAPALRRTPAWSADYDAAFQLGITALQARRTAEAIASFRSCLDLNPASGVCAYNLACGHALAGEVDAAFEWMEQARQRGWGMDAGALELLRGDPDLAELRRDPRFEELMDGLRADGERTRSFVRTPALWTPAVDAQGLLVVLHAGGETKEDVVGGAWRALAERHDLALLAPSGASALQADPELGMGWYESVEEFSERPWDVEQPVALAIRAACDALGLEPRDVVIAGEGAGGCVALDLALRTPGTLRAALVLDAPLLLEGAERRARVAAAMGLGVHVAFREGRRVPDVPGDVSQAENARSVGAWLEAVGLRGGATVLDPASAFPAPWDELLAR